MSKYWLALHKRLSRSDINNSEDAWRYRKFTTNGCKIDPQWEEGRYNTCHDIPQKASKGDWIFDAICPKSAVDLRVIRSAYEITDERGGALHFESYHFLDGDWKEGIVLTNRRGAHEVDPHRGQEWINVIQNLETYSHNLAGEKSQSHSNSKWNEMVTRTPRD